MKVTLLVLLYLTIINVVYSAKILGIFSAGARSHYILGSALMKELANKGHDVTIVSPFSEKNKPTNGSWTEITLDGVLEKMEEILKSRNFLEMPQQNIINKIIGLFFVNTLCAQLTEEVYAHPKVQQLLSSNEHFDAVIVEQFMNDALKYLATHFNAPLITFSLYGQSVWTNHLVGNPEIPSFVGDLVLGNTNRMNLLTRVQNTLFWTYTKIFSKLYGLPLQKAIYDKFFPNAKADFYEVLYNSSIVLLNSHVSSWEPSSLMPNMIEIGGFHIQPPKALPNDLQHFLDTAEHGAIYFSMGSNLKSKDLPTESRNAIINVFAKLKQKILWKFEEENLPGKPDNVKIVKWAPQQDLLAHPNVKLFITHGGFGGMQETIYHGVPILALPVFGDQELNAQKAANAEFGLKLRLADLKSEETFEKAIKELLDNPKYAKNAKTKSKIMQDRPLSAKDTATFWVEYVIRHQGAPHLRTAAMDLTWYQYIMLDVLAIIGGTTAVIVLVLSYLVKACCCRKSYSKKNAIKLE